MFSSSIMCVNQLDLKDYINMFNRNHFGMLHIDIMDGRFVHNIMYGPYILKDLRKYTDLKFDIHLMVDHPEYKIDMFDISKNDRVSIHCESTDNLLQTLMMYKEKAGEVFIAINPSTPVCTIEEAVDYADGILVMCVNPGFSSQNMIMTVPNKIKRIRDRWPNLRLEVDGHITPDYYKQFKDLGVEDFVLGTSFIFKKDIDFCENIVRGLINE